MLKQPLRAILSRLSRVPYMWDILVGIHTIRHRRDPWMQQHPIDRQYGTRTGGSVPPWLLTDGSEAGKHANIYAGCQPSCMRQALDAIPDPSRFIFIDVGCGKGRALVVASEYPFQRNVGVELSAKLARQARRSAEIVARAFPGRSPIEVVVGDAASVALPSGDAVVFIYHAFDEVFIQQYLQSLVQLIDKCSYDLFLVYENPVHGALVDAEPSFVRWFDEMVPCTAAERRASHIDGDAIIVWRAGPKAQKRRDGARKRIIAVQKDQVALVPD